MDKKTKPKLVVISAKVAPEIREFIERKAKEEDRSISQIISRLFSSHPEVQKSKSLALQA